MKHIVFFIVFLISISSFANRFSSGGKGSKVMLGGYYGMGFINPKDINTSLSSQTTTPRLNNITQETALGGVLGYMLSPKFQLGVAYEQQTAKNEIRTTTPAVSGAGYELSHSALWLNLNLFLVNTNKAYVYFGVAGGYPLTSKVTTVLAARTEYDADKTINYKGQLGFGYKLANPVSLFIETSYQSIVSGDIKRGSTTLTLPNGSRAKLDLTGVKVLGGLALHF